MRNAEFTPQERALIERVQHAPQPDLKLETYEKIRQQLLAEVDLLPVSGTQPRLSSHVSLRTVMIVFVVVLIIAVLVSILLRQVSSQVVLPASQPSLTSTSSGETLMPTLVFTQTPLMESIGQITAEATGATPAPTSTPTATATPPATNETVIVIEGPVSQINGSSMTIFDMNIQVSPDDPILTSIKIGDSLQVTGKVTVENGVIIVVAINITVINMDITEAAPGSALPPDCKITKKGHLKCSKKK